MALSTRGLKAWPLQPCIGTRIATPQGPQPETMGPSSTPSGHTPPPEPPGLQPHTPVTLHQLQHPWALSHPPAGQNQPQGLASHISCPTAVLGPPSPTPETPGPRSTHQWASTSPSIWPLQPAPGPPQAEAHPLRTQATHQQTGTSPKTSCMPACQQQLSNTLGPSVSLRSSP